MKTEIQSLIKYCENTPQCVTRDIAKQRLMELTEVDNKWAEIREVTDYSHLFSEMQIEIIRYYIANPNMAISKIYGKFGLNRAASYHFLNRFFKLTKDERDLIF